jgi:hypothetical protein
MVQEPPTTDPMDNLAIVEPEIPHESVNEVLKRFFKFGLPVAMRAHYGICCQLVDDALRECDHTGVEDGFSHSTLQAATELLKLFTEPANKYDGRLLAHVMLLVMNRNPMSEVEIARLCNVTRACVSKLKVDLQDRYGMRPRCGRSDEARKKFSKLVCLRGPRRKDSEWKAKSLFGATLRSESKPSGERSKNTGTKRSRQRGSRRSAR